MPEQTKQPPLFYQGFPCITPAMLDSLLCLPINTTYNLLKRSKKTLISNRDYFKNDPYELLKQTGICLPNTTGNNYLLTKQGCLTLTLVMLSNEILKGTSGGKLIALINSALGINEHHGYITDKLICESFWQLYHKFDDERGDNPLNLSKNDKLIAINVQHVKNFCSMHGINIIYLDHLKHHLIKSERHQFVKKGVINSKIESKSCRCMIFNK